MGGITSTHIAAFFSALLSRLKYVVSQIKREKVEKVLHTIHKQSNLLNNQQLYQPRTCPLKTSDYYSSIWWTTNRWSPIKLLRWRSALNIRLVHIKSLESLESLETNDSNVQKTAF